MDVEKVEFLGCFLLFSAVFFAKSIRHLLTLLRSVNTLENLIMHFRVGIHACCCFLYVVIALLHASVVLCVLYTRKCKLSCKCGIKILCLLY